MDEVSVAEETPVAVDTETPVTVEGPASDEAVMLGEIGIIGLFYDLFIIC